MTDEIERAKHRPKADLVGLVAACSIIGASILVRWLADSTALAGATGQAGQETVGVVAVALLVIGIWALILNSVALVWDLIGWARGQASADHG
jgi:hypothetical protein